MQPSKNELPKFISLFYETLIKGSKNKLSIFGPQSKNISTEELPENIHIHNNHNVFIEQFLSEPVII